MSGAEKTCDICTRAQATGFCWCSGRETFACEKCFVEHYQKDADIAHYRLPLAVHGQHRISGYYERLQTRIRSTEAAKVEVLKNIETIDKCIAEVAMEVEKVIVGLKEFADKTVMKLNRTKAELEKIIREGITEAENTVHEDSLLLKTRLARSIRSYSGNPDVLRFFTYTVNSSEVVASFNSLCKIVSENIEEVFILPGIKDNALQVYNIDTNETKSLPLSKTFTDGVQLCFIDNNEVLAVGASPASTAAVTIKLANAEVTDAPPMRTARRLPGLAVVDFEAYAFGGECASCEKYQIGSKSWAQLPSMRYSKSAFSPCRLGDEIYLFDAAAGGNEAFNLSTQAFRVLSISSPLRGNSIAVKAGDEILIVTSGNQFGRWKPGVKSITPTEVTCGEDNPISQCQPVFYRDEVYFVAWRTARLNSFNVATSTVAIKTS